MSTLAPTLRGHDAVVDLTNRTATDVQLVIDATIAAQVPRLIPSCFGIGTTHPTVRSLPHIAGKIKVQDYYEQKAREGALTFSAIQTGIFLELALQGGRIISLSDEQPTTLFDGGDRPLSSTSIDSIGQAVAVALTKPEETKNRFLCVQNTILTQNKLLLLAKELAPQRLWTVTHRDTAEMERASWEAWNAGDRTPRATAGFFVRAGFGDGGVGAFQKLDNDLLMIKEYSDDELKNFLSKCPPIPASKPAQRHRHFLYKLIPVTTMGGVSFDHLFGKDVCNHSVVLYNCFRPGDFPSIQVWNQHQRAAAIEGILYYNFASLAVGTAKV